MEGDEKTKSNKFLHKFGNTVLSETVLFLILFNSKIPCFQAIRRKVLDYNFKINKGREEN